MLVFFHTGISLSGLKNNFNSIFFQTVFPKPLSLNNSEVDISLQPD